MRERLAAEAVHSNHRNQLGNLQLLDHLPDGAEASAGVEHQREVALDRREAGERLVAALAQAGGVERFQVELGQVGGLAQLEGGGYGRSQLAEHAQRFLAGKDGGAVGGMEASGVARLEPQAVEREGFERRFERALESEEVVSLAGVVHALGAQLAGGRQGEHATLAEAPAFNGVGLANLIEANVALAAVDVAGHGLGQAEQAGGAEDGRFLRERLGDANQLPAGGEEFFRFGGIDGREVDGFIEAQPFHALAQRFFRPSVRLARHRLARGRQMGGELVVTVVAGDLFDQVNLAGDVAAEGRDGDTPLVDGFAPAGEAEGGEDALGGLVGHGRAQDAQNFLAAQGELRALPAAGIDVDGASQQLAAGQFEEELGAAARGAQRGFHVHAALEAVAGFGAQAEVFGGAAGGDGLKPSRFEQDVAGGEADLGVGAAHDAGQRHGAAGVGDEQVVRLERALDAVERGELFARLGAADDDAAVAEQVEVEGVGGVAELEQDVVGDVHDVVDGGEAAGFQALAQPVGRRLDFYVA